MELPIDVTETALRNIAALAEEPGRGQALLHVGLVSLAAGSALLYGMQFIALGMFDTRTPALR